MPIYRVLGARQQLFSATVHAYSKLEAYDKADEMGTELWSEIETDNVIEVIEVDEER